MNKDEIHVGDEVRVFDRNGHRLGQPEWGWPGKVVKIGRTLVTIEYQYGTSLFRLENCTINDGWGHAWFRTVAQVELMRRGEAAWQALASIGLRLDYGHARPPLELMEALAAVVAKHAADNRDAKHEEDSDVR